MKQKLIAINKEEKDAVLAKFPNVHIVRTMKQKSKRHRYYCEESRGVMKLIENMRSGNTESRKEVGRHTNTKNGRRNSV